MRTLTRHLELQTLKLHNLAMVIQAVWRGMQVRTWFRASLAAASRAMKDRDRFKRLASLAGIGRSSSIANVSEKDFFQTDALAVQVCSAAVFRCTLAQRCNQNIPLQPSHAVALKTFHASTNTSPQHVLPRLALPRAEASMTTVHSV
jgi:IQ calmodulin-binding motif